MEIRSKTKFEYSRDMYGDVLKRFSLEDIENLGDILSCVRKIGEVAFKGLDIEYIYIPKSIKFIDESAFKNCKKLKKVVFDIESEVKHINASCFEGCTSLETVELSPSIRIIGSKAFKGCKSLQNIVFWGRRMGIEPFAFDKCNPNFTTLTLHTGSMSSSRAFGGKAFDLNIQDLPYVPSYAEKKWEALQEYKAKVGAQNAKDRARCLTTAENRGKRIIVNKPDSMSKSLLEEINEDIKSL